MKVSVIVPVYNAEKYIDRCIKSVLDQSYEDIELILVNDGSSDMSKEICERYIKEDVRVVVISQNNNKGQSAARNKGLDVATGDYIGFLDSDDWFHKDYVAVLLRAINETGADAATCDIFRTNDILPKEIPITEKVKYTICKNDHIIEHMNEYLHSSNLAQYISYGIFGLYSKKCFDGVRFNEKIFFNEEGPFIIELNVRAQSVVHVHLPIYYYFEGNGNSVSRSQFSARRMTGLLSYEDELRLFEKHGIPNKEKIIYKLFVKYFDYFFQANNSDLEDEFCRYKYIFESHLSKFIKAKELKCLEKILCLFYFYNIPGWEKIFGKIENKEKYMRIHE